MLKFEVDHMAGLLLGDLPGRQPFSSTPTDKPPVGDQLESGGGCFLAVFFNSFHDHNVDLLLHYK